MSEQEFIELTLDFSNALPDEEPLESLTQGLYRELSQRSEIHKINRVLEPLPLGKMGGGKPKPGWLDISVIKTALEKVSQFLCENLHSKKFKIICKKNQEVVIDIKPQEIKAYLQVIREELERHCK